MKYLLVLLVIAIAVWLWTARRRGPSSPPSAPRRRNKAAAEAATPMLACAHCGVHLPQTDAQLDAVGRPYCSEAHRLAGPR